jgi:hypothetical protein
VDERFGRPPARDVQFVTAPNVPYSGDPAAELSFAQPQASRLFQAITHDTTMPKAIRVKPRGTSVVPALLYAAPSTVKVQVLNGSGGQRHRLPGRGRADQPRLPGHRDRRRA